MARYFPFSAGPPSERSGSAAALAWQKLSGTRSAGAPRAETPDGQPAEIGLGVHVPFGPMLAVAGAVYFLFLRGWVDAWFDQRQRAFLTSSAPSAVRACRMSGRDPNFPR